jgi:hypothetical protein
MMRSTIIFKLVLFLILPFVGAGQKFATIKEMYPKEEAVQVIFSRDLRFFMENGKLLAESEYQQDIMLLNEKTASFFSKSSVYHSGFNELKSLEAFTIFPDGKKKQPITEKKTTAATQGFIFYDDSRETSFNFPSLQPGATTSVNHVLRHTEPRLIGPFIYTSSLPALKISFTVTVPDGIEVDYLVKNDVDKRFVFTKERKRGNTVYRWEMNQVKNDLRYGDAPDEYYYMPHVIVYVKSYQDQQNNKVFGTVADLYKWNFGFLEELNKMEDPALRAITDSLVAGKKTQLEKAVAIYKWVQANIRYVAFEQGLEGFRPRQAADVCRKKYGDCKDMSSIITQMLKMCGMEAYYTWIGTRDIPYKYSDVALPIVDNHMISVARIEGKWYFIDGTASNALIDMPPHHIQGKEALLAISKDEYKILTVPVAASNASTLVDSTFIKLTDQGIAGSQQVNYQGYFATDVWDELLYKNDRNRQEFVKRKMGKGSNKFILGKYEISDNKDAGNAKITADFEIPGYGKKVGDEYYLNLNLEKVFEGQLIDTAKRKIPKSIDYLFTIEQNHILEIPEGYSVSYKPEDLLVDNDYYRVEIKYTSQQKQLIATQRITSKSLFIDPADFVKWNKDLPAIQSHYKEQVVLEKHKK